MDDVELGQEERPQRLHTDQPAGSRPLCDLARLRSIESERLLDQRIPANVSALHKRTPLISDS